MSVLLGSMTVTKTLTAITLKEVSFAFVKKLTLVMVMSAKV